VLQNAYIADSLISGTLRFLSLDTKLFAHGLACVLHVRCTYWIGLRLSRAYCNLCLRITVAAQSNA
jgi:hypothetical protein